MNLKVIIAVSLVVGAVAFGMTGFKKTMTPYIGFAEARQNTGLVQINGTLVPAPATDQEATSTAVSFELPDSADSPAAPVRRLCHAPAPRAASPARSGRTPSAGRPAKT